MRPFSVAALLCLFCLSLAQLEHIAETPIWPRLLDGCTNDCDRIKDYNFTCTRIAKECNSQYIRQWRPVENCAVTACAAGTLDYAGNYADVLVCKNGTWWAKGRNHGKMPAITCSLRGCNKCTGPVPVPELNATDACPDKEEGACDPELLCKSQHPDTGCIIWECGYGTQLVVKVKGDNDWSMVDYIDCHHDRFFRFGSVRTMERGQKFVATCLKPECDCAK